MTKSLTKLWLGGIKKMLHTPTPHWPKGMTGTTFPFPVGASVPEASAAPSADPATSPVASTVTRESRDSRVRPRAAAWAGGDWLRAAHPLPWVPGRLVTQLDYALYVPRDLPPGAPLVVMLHGCQQNADQFAQGTCMNLLADRHGFAVLYPEQSVQVHPHGCWQWYEDTERGGRGEAAAVMDLVDALIDERHFDASRVYVAGLSAGAGLATLLALHAPERIAAVALHSGPAFGDAQSGITAMDVMRRGLHRPPCEVVDSCIAPGSYPGMPALIVHGDVDPVVAPRNAEQLADQFLRLNGMLDAQGTLLAADRIETDLGGARLIDYLRRASATPRVRLCLVDGLGHAWSGGDDTVPFHAAIGPGASEMIWGFFAERHRAAVVR